MKVAGQDIRLRRIIYGVQNRQYIQHKNKLYALGTESMNKVHLKSQLFHIHFKFKTKKVELVD